MGRDLLVAALVVVAIGLVCVWCGVGLMALDGPAPRPTPSRVERSGLPGPIVDITRTPLPTVGASTASPVPLAAPEVYYGSCAEVHAAGKAPIRRGQPGYRTGLDRDGDGTACDD